MRPVLVSAILSGVVLGCETASPVAMDDRHNRLLSMAAAEAGQIPDAQGRLKRQLNLADRQLDDGRATDAQQTLAAATGTMRDTRPADLPPRIRVAGWVSISELSRRAKDFKAADAACDQAVVTLRSLDPVSERPEYALGVADELRENHGKSAAAHLLIESAGWAGQINDQERRRTLLAEIASATFRCDEYPGGLAVLRADPDAAWRSDALADLASQAMPTESFARAGIVAQATPIARSGERVSQPVDFRSVFGSTSR